MYLESLKNFDMYKIPRTWLTVSPETNNKARRWSEGTFLIFVFRHHRQSLIDVIYVCMYVTMIYMGTIYY